MKIRNVSCAPNQHIRMISEGLCDIEDWNIQFCCITVIKYILKHIFLFYTITVLLNKGSIGAMLLSET